MKMSKKKIFIFFIFVISITFIYFLCFNKKTVSNTINSYSYKSNNVEDVQANDAKFSNVTGTYLESSYRDLSFISTKSSGISEATYPRINKLSNGKYLLLFHNNLNGSSVYFKISDNIKKFQDSTTKVLFKKQDITGENKIFKLYTNGDAIVLNDGTIIAIACYRIYQTGSSVDKINYADQPGSNGIAMKVSNDNGVTWSDEKIIYRGTSWEGTLLQLKSGEIQLYFSMCSPIARSYQSSSGVGLIRSYDNGKTWRLNSQDDGSLWNKNLTEENGWNDYIAQRISQTEKTGYELGLTTTAGFLNNDTGEIEDSNATFPKSSYTECVPLREGYTYEILGYTKSGESNSLQVRGYDNSKKFEGNIEMSKDSSGNVIPKFLINDSNYRYARLLFLKDVGNDIITLKITTNQSLTKGDIGSFKDVWYSDFIETLPNYSYSYEDGNDSEISWMLYDNQKKYLRTVNDTKTCKIDTSDVCYIKVVMKKNDKLLNDITLNVTVKRFTDQMPGAVELNNGSIALVTETQSKDENSTMKISEVWNSDNWKIDLGTDEEGPYNDKFTSFFEGSAPGIEKLSNSKTIIQYGNNGKSYIRLGDENAKFSQTEYELFKNRSSLNIASSIANENGISNFKVTSDLCTWSDIFCDDKNSLIASTGNAITLKNTDSSTLKKYKVILMTKIYIDTNLEALKYDNANVDSFWNQNNSSIFIGSDSQAQMTIKMAHDNENTYMLLNRLDESLTDDDTLELYLNNSKDSSNYYKLILSKDGIKSFEKFENGVYTSMDTGKITTMFKQINSSNDENGGYSIEISIPKSIISIENLKLNAKMYNRDRQDTNITEDLIDNTSIEDLNTWININFAALEDKATSLNLNYSDYTFNNNKPLMLKATVIPKTANQSVKWESSNTNVATVDNTGKVAPVGKGTCKITTTTIDGTNISKICNITSNVVYIKGDINKDGRVDVSDVIYGLKKVVSGTISKEENKIGDVNGNNIFDITDAIKIMNYIVGKIKSL